MDRVLQYGDVSDVLQRSRTRQPKNYFQDIKYDFQSDTEWTSLDNFTFHVTVSYPSKDKNGNVIPYDGKWLRFEQAMIPPRNYMKELWNAMSGAYSCKLLPNSWKIDMNSKEFPGNDNFLSVEKENADGILIPQFEMKPEFELAFMSNFMEVNCIADDDKKFLPEYFTSQVHQFFSRNIQRITWSIEVNNQNLLNSQRQQFLADFINTWNNPLYKFKRSKESGIATTESQVTPRFDYGF